MAGEAPARNEVAEMATKFLPRMFAIALIGTGTFLGSHAPVRHGPEKIVRVGDALASQMGVLHFPKKTRYHALFGVATPQS